MKRLFIIFATLLLATGLTFAQDAAGDIVGRINALRTDKGLPTYNINGALVAAAQNQAQWLVNNDCAIAHTHPDGSNPRSRALEAGYSTGNVGENIYCGGMAGPNNAWVFWVNSGIHYAGLVNTRYKEVGVASATGAAGTSYVIVFGDPGGPAYVPPAPAGSSGGGEGSAPQAPPSYVVGVDVHGNIEHQIQGGDTLGQIALIYGYTWNDIPGMLALNGMTEADYRNLKEGEIFLVPPQAGTYTPTPGEPTAVVATAEPTSIYPTPYPDETLSLLPDPTQAEVVQPTLPPQVMVATSNAMPDNMVALLPTPAPSATSPSTGVISAGVMPAVSGTPPWLVVGLGVQIVVLVGAGFEYVRRHRRR